MRTLLQATLVIAMMTLAVGCSKKPELVGRWENTTVPELIEFKPDNTGVIQGKNLPPLSFVWQETAKNTYSLDVGFQGQKKRLKGAVDNGTLVLVGEGGKETYRKVTSQ
ncbi:MAG: hypothetical protein WCP20_01705 [Desulfuromonadales bacterium]